MAIRECYFASNNHVEKFDIEFEYFNGFSPSQKKKSIKSLHEQILKANITQTDKLLEVSSKSEASLGIALSAFNLSTKTKKGGNKYTVESAFQSSKVFEGNIQFKDIIELDSLSAKRDPRLKTSGDLSHFQFFTHRFELSTQTGIQTAFYDWLYINVLLQNSKLCEEVMKYRAFTDIEFNSKKSINSQALSIALFVSLKLADVDMSEFKNPEIFLQATENFYPNKKLL